MSDEELVKPAVPNDTNGETESESVSYGQVVVVGNSCGMFAVQLTVDMSKLYDDNRTLSRLAKCRDLLENMERARHVMDRIGNIWMFEGNERRISHVKSEGARVMLSLLAAYPAFRTQKEIAGETALHSGSVSRILSGKRGHYDRYIEKKDKTYRLNRQGIEWVACMLVPELARLHSAGDVTIEIVPSRGDETFARPPTVLDET